MTGRDDLKNLPTFARGRAGLGRVVELAHRHLGLDVVAVAELCQDELVLRAVANDGSHFALTAGHRHPAAGTFCQLLLAGEIGPPIGDTASDVRVANLASTTQYGVGAFIGVPLHCSDGSVYGVLAGLSRSADITLGPRDLRFMKMLADLVVADLDEQRRHERTAADIGQVINAKALRMAWQPIVEIHTGRNLGVEALARFSLPWGPPDQTFAAAAQVGLGLELERLAVSEAWKFLEELPPGQFLSVNLGPQALLELAARANHRSDVHLDRVVVELTEHAVVENYEPLRDVLRPLRRRGLRVAIDDAGAGYACLHHIVEMAPDFIKVDRSLIDGVADDRARQFALQAFALLARNLGSCIIAEGVERPSDLEALCQLGVDVAQGYLLGRPTIGGLAEWASRLPGPVQPAYTRPTRPVQEQESPGGEEDIADAEHIGQWPSPGDVENVPQEREVRPRQPSRVHVLAGMGNASRANQGYRRGRHDTSVGADGDQVEHPAQPQEPQPGCVPVDDEERHGKRVARQFQAIAGPPA